MFPIQYMESIAQRKVTSAPVPVDPCNARISPARMMNNPGWWLFFLNELDAVRAYESIVKKSPGPSAL